MMNSFDFLIIYLTCGAPLGVFYFLQNRKQQIGIRLWLKTFFTFVFWLPSGFQLLENKLRENFPVGREIFSKTAKPETEISLFRKQFEDVLQKSSLQISIFEFREVFERYVGLTIAKDYSSGEITETEKEIFHVVNGGKNVIGAICLNRRNLKRLTFHQTQARQDFFQIINRIAALSSDKSNFMKLAADFFRLLKDFEAQVKFDEALSDILQTEKSFIVKRSERYLWNSEIHKSPAVKSTPLQLQTLTVRANSSAKD